MRRGRGIRWGLCCQFLDVPIRFRTATHRYVSSLSTQARRAYVSEIVRHNAGALEAAVRACSALGIGAFRITSGILPLATHPVSGYRLDDLDDDGSITGQFQAVAALARASNIRLSFHPDQFIVLNSERRDIVRAAVGELDAQASVAELLGVDVITLHAGSGAGGVEAGLDRLRRGIAQLSERARTRLAIENDDRLFTITDLEPVARDMSVPLVFDVHHHRCHPARLTIADATELAAETWGNREPYFHVSSPRDGRRAPNPRPHAEYVAVRDVPVCWRDRAITVDVEAKAKERAVITLRDAVAAAGKSRRD